MGSGPQTNTEKHRETQNAKNQAGGVAIFRGGLKNGVGTTFALTW